MAFKGFGNLENLSKDLDAFVASATLIGPIEAAETIVAELQYAGPLWTGRFANSWQIIGPQGQTAKGTGRPGTTQPVKFIAAPFTGPQAAAVFLRKLVGNKVVFNISNFATGPDGPYALKAMDIQEGKFEYPGIEPIKKATRGVRTGEYRGNVVPTPTGPNRITAPQDWYANYVRGGGLDKAVRLTMDKELGRFRR